MDIFIVFLVLILVATGVSTYLNHKRAQLIESLAAEWGFTYRKQAQNCLPRERFDLFSKGRNCHLANVIRREQGSVMVSIGEYTYTTGSGKNRSRHCQTVVILDSERLALPQFSLMPENVLHKIGQLFGYKDIDFDTHPDFSQFFLLRGPDEIRIREAFDTDVLDFFEMKFFERQQRISVEGAGSTLIYYYADRRRDPRRWQQMIAEALKVYEQFCLS
ncbi:MAG: hypothetical protein AAFN12_09265 [Cyanobacteria bacterium J06560_2]